MRKAITREKFWDILQEAKSQNDHQMKKHDEMMMGPRGTSLVPLPPQSNKNNSTDDDDQNPTSSGITKLPPAAAAAAAHTRTKQPGGMKGQEQPLQAKDDQNVSRSRKAVNLLATGPHSKFLEDFD